MHNLGTYTRSWISLHCHCINCLFKSVKVIILIIVTFLYFYIYLVNHYRIGKTKLLNAVKFKKR